MNDIDRLSKRVFGRNDVFCQLFNLLLFNGDGVLFCAFSDVIESAFPLVDFLSRGFGTNNEKHFVVLAEHVNHLLDEVVAVTTVDGNGSEFQKQASENRVFEKFGFHHHFEMQPLRPEKCPPYEKVFYRSVWCHNADAFPDVIGYGVDGFPAANP